MRKMLKTVPIARGISRFDAKVIHRSRYRRSDRRVLLKAHLWFLLVLLHFVLQTVTKPFYKL
jgi:hypothetical protein